VSGAAAYPDGEARRLDEALRQWIEAVPAGFQTQAPDAAARYGITAARLRALDSQFEQLALELFAYQYERVPLYGAYARALQRHPSQVRRAVDVPALPVEALRHARVAAFPEAHEAWRFHTSGTRGRPGVLHLDSLQLYDLILERGFAHHVVPDVESIRMLLLVPTLKEVPHSSLGYMLDRVRQRWGTRRSAHYVRQGELQWPSLRRELSQAVEAGEPLCLLGTTFALVGLLDASAQEGWRVELPQGSRIFETGGTKGRTREIQRAELLRALEETLGVPSTHVVSEYGMTELASQYYTLSLRLALQGHAPEARGQTWSAPFWLRPRLVEADTGACVDVEEARDVALLAHHDLGNRCSVAHWLTADLAVPWQGSFRLQGRAPQSEARGCGLVHEHLQPTGEDA
jgi:hypothetical protein